MSDETTVRSLLARAEKNRAKFESEFADSGVRVRGLNDLLVYMESALEAARAEPKLIAVEFFLHRANGDLEVAIIASLFGLLSVVADAMRDMMEIALLLRQFVAEPSNIEQWFSLDDRERQRLYKPNRLRQLHANRLDVQVQDLPDSRDYAAHSMTLHVGPKRGPFRRGLAISPDIMSETDIALAEIFGHARQVTGLSYELAVTLDSGTKMPDPQSAAEFQAVAENARDFTLPFLMAMMGVMQESSESGDESSVGDEGNV